MVAEQRATILATRAVLSASHRDPNTIFLLMNNVISDF